MASGPFVQAKVQGLAELAEALKALPAEVASRSGGPLASALRSSARVIADEARRNAESLPVSDTDERDDYIRTGNLARSIGVRRDPNPRDVTERAVVRPSRRAWYWRFVEFGTEKMPARPFLRPAFEAKREEAVRVFREALAKSIARAARKAARLGLRNRGR